MKLPSFQQVRRFGSKALHAGESAAKFVAGKALPTVTNVAGRVASLAMKATPVIAAAAPELLPVVAGVGVLAKGVQKGGQETQKLIRVGTEAVQALKGGDVKTAIEKGRQVQSGVSKTPQVVSAVVKQLPPMKKINS